MRSSSSSVSSGGVDRAGHELRHQPGLAPPGERSPRTPERHANVAIAQRDRDVVGLGRPGRLEQLGARGDAELAAQPLLVRGEHEVHQQGGELLLPDHLAKVEPLEASLLRQRLVALGVELDADPVGLLLLDHLADEVDGVLGDVSGPDQHELAARDVDDVDVARRAGFGRGFARLGGGSSRCPSRAPVSRLALVVLPGGRCAARPRRARSSLCCVPPGRLLPSRSSAFEGARSSPVGGPPSPEFLEVPRPVVCLGLPARAPHAAAGGLGPGS